jgi:hypothetical protein
MEATHHPLPHHLDSNLNLTSLQPCWKPALLRLVDLSYKTWAEITTGNWTRLDGDGDLRWIHRPASQVKMHVLANFCLFRSQILYLISTSRRSMNFPILESTTSPGLPPLSSGDFDRSGRLLPPSMCAEDTRGDSFSRSFREEQGRKESPCSILDQEETQDHIVDRRWSSDSPTRDDSTSRTSASAQRKKRYVVI